MNEEITAKVMELNALIALECERAGLKSKLVIVLEEADVVSVGVFQNGIPQRDAHFVCAVANEAAILAETSTTSIAKQALMAYFSKDSPLGCGGFVR